MQKILVAIASIVLLAPSSTQAQTTDEKAFVNGFLDNCKSVQSAILEKPLTAALVDSGSVLYVYRDYSDLVTLTRKIRAAYGVLSIGDASQEFARRDTIHSASPLACFECFDSSLLAMSLGEYDSATDLLASVVHSPEFVGNPTPHAVRGEAFLLAGNLSEATRAYETAVALAEESRSPGLTFRMRNLYIDDLYDYGHADAAITVAMDGFESEYPLERAWTLAQSVNYYWGQEEYLEAIAAFDALEELIPTLKPDPNSDFERRVYELMYKTYHRMREALEGNTNYKMIMDEESIELHLVRHEDEKAIERLEPWTVEFPLVDYPRWKQEERSWRVWVHFTCSVAHARIGNASEAMRGFERIIAHVPFEQDKGRVVSSWCWLGYTLGLQGRFGEAVQAYETGLALDVSESPEKGLPLDYQQPRVIGGIESPKYRAMHVYNYTVMLEAFSAKEKGE